MRTIQILLLIMISLTACTQPTFDCAKLKETIAINFTHIDSMRRHESASDTYEIKMDSLNKELENNLIALVENDRFQICDLKYKTDFSYLLSADKNFCIISWDTRLGGTMPDFATSVIYKTKNSTQFKNLKNGEADFEDNLKILFYTLSTLTNNEGQAIYLAYGFGRGGNVEPFQTLKAFMITDSLVEKINLFPNKTSELWIQYDLHQFKEDDEMLEIEISNGGKNLKVPVLDFDRRPTGEYYYLKFDGINYKQK